MSQNSGFGESIDEYEVLGLLGKGGFATVYRARSKRNNQMVAIKMIDKKLIHSAGLTDRVRQEVEIHSRLKHPFVVELYTFFQDADYVYLVMELATNGELQRYMKDQMGRPMSENEAAAILNQTVSGILYLHSHRIMHRDISLSNLLLSKNMDVKIADFGLATQLKQIDEKHLTMCGTPNFISPEVASRASHGLPADVWAIGCLLYTLLVGRPPFDTHAVQATLTKVVMSDYFLPEHLSFEAKDLINRLLKKDPKERIALLHIIKHPFMQRYSSPSPSSSSSSSTQTTAGTVAISSYSSASSAMGFSNTASSYSHSNASCDSGIITFASSSTSNSFRPPNLRAANAHEQPTIKEETESAHIFQRNLLNYNSNQVNDYYSKEMDWLSVKSSEKSQSQWPVTSRCALPSQQNYHPTSSSGIGNCAQANYCSDMIAGIPNAQSTHMNAAAIVVDGAPKEKQLQRITVPPLNTVRLQPTRFRNKNAIMSILKGGEVVVEFIKFRGRLNEDRITDICWISKDGQRIIIYEPDPGRGLPIGNEPPELPQQDTRLGIFTYDNLPSKHWRKYLFASRFVSLVKASTPKVTYFSEQAKFHLMESMTHFEMFFYDGSKVTQSPNEGLKVYNRLGQLMQPHEHTTPTALALLEHQEICLKHCESICKALELIQRNDSFSCFPVIIGRRPIRDHRIGRVNDSTMARDRMNINAKTLDKIEISDANFGSYSDFKLNTEKLQRSYGANDNACAIKTLNITGFGKATEFSNGTVHVEFYDGSIISVPSDRTNRNCITYVQSNGVATHFAPNDDLPLEVREKLHHLPHIEEQLRNTKSNSPTYSCNSVVFSTPTALKSARMYTSTPALNDAHSVQSMRYFR